MSYIFTHVNVDLDAVCSVWFARNVMRHPGALAFKPANWDGSDAAPDDVILDIDASGKGLKGEKADGVVHSCFASLVAKADERTQRALRHLVAYVDAQDAHGNAAAHLVEKAGGIDTEFQFSGVGREKELVETLSATGINAVLRALQKTLKGTDGDVVRAMSPILDGLLECGFSRIDAEEEADKAEIVGGRVAIVRDSKHMATNGVLMERGIEAVVFVDGNNMGISRRNDVTVHMAGPATSHVVKEAGEAEEWFAHPAGFLFARGTRKAPANEPSKVNPRKLALAVLKQLG